MRLFLEIKHTSFVDLHMY